MKVEGHPGLSITTDPNGTARVVAGGGGWGWARTFAFGGGKRTLEEAIREADFAVKTNGKRLHARLTAPKPRARKTHSFAVTSKESFPESFKTAIKRRDGRCVGNGRYWKDCDGSYPLEFCQVDHIDPDGDHSMENGQTLCQNCHGVKTAAERAAGYAAVAWPE